jgi:ABC-2 type transport system permease protein
VRDAALVLSQARAAFTVALRTPRTLLLTVVFPLVFLVLFNSIFIHGRDHPVVLPNGLGLDARAYFTAGIVAYAIALSTFSALAVSLTAQRESGQLKRLRGTPMPTWIFIAAQILRATVQALVMTGLLLALGATAYGVHVPAANLPGFLLYVVLGTAMLCALGIALSCFTPTPEAASTIATFGVVMLSFVSGVWIPVDDLPRWLEAVGEIFPLYHLTLGLQTALAPGAGAAGLNGPDVAIVAAWALVGIAIAAFRFRWEP